MWGICGFAVRLPFAAQTSSSAHRDLTCRGSRIGWQAADLRRSYMRNRINCDGHFGLVILPEKPVATPFCRIKISVLDSLWFACWSHAAGASRCAVHRTARLVHERIVKFGNGLWAGLGPSCLHRSYPAGGRSAFIWPSLLGISCDPIAAPLFMFSLTRPSPSHLRAYI